MESVIRDALKSVVMVLVGFLAACSAADLERIGKNLTGDGTKSDEQSTEQSPDARSTKTATPYYVGTDNLGLYREPKTESLIERLALHEKVVRTDLNGGWAFVTVERTGVQGWLDNARLIWKLPKEEPAKVTEVPADDPAPIIEATPAADVAPASAVEDDESANGYEPGIADTDPAARPPDPSILDPF